MECSSMVWIFSISLYSDERNTNEYRKFNWKFFLIECCMLDCISGKVFNSICNDHVGDVPGGNIGRRYCCGALYSKG